MVGHGMVKNKIYGRAFFVIVNPEYLSYDAWGRRRKPNYTSIYTDITPSFDRGYTMHEHYDKFGLSGMQAGWFVFRCARGVDS